MVDSIQDIRWTDSKTQEKKTYYYRVTAKDSSGKESAPSQEFKVSTDVAVAATGEKKNVIGMKTKPVFRVTDKDFTEAGIIGISEPFDIEPSPDRSKYYVSSVHTQSVIIFKADGSVLATFGSKGQRPGEFLEPYGVAVAANGNVYVADHARNDVQEFTADGKFLRQVAVIKREEWMEKDPAVTDVVVEPSGEIHVLEYWHGALFTFSPSGERRSHFRLNTNKEDGTGYLSYVRLLDGKFYFADIVRGTVAETDRKGKILRRLGGRGVGVGLVAQLGGFDIAGGKAYFIDRQNYLVQVYDFATNKYLFTLANDKNDAMMPVVGLKNASVDAGTNRIYLTQGMANQVAAFEMFGKPEEAAGK
jgi:hypothetical protein